MYRRLKNILGVSFIIFAIVLAQLPMGNVLADEESTVEETKNVNTVTFNMNGGTYNGSYNGYEFKNQTPVLVLDNGSRIIAFPSENSITYEGYETEEDTWFTDRTCLTKFNKEQSVTEDITLYKKWYSVTDGFYISADGSVLYKYDGNAQDVVIPESVKLIASNAFASMGNIQSVTLPANINEIQNNAFSGANAAGRTISLLDSETEQSVNKCKAVANSYSNLVYQEVSTASEETGNVDVGVATTANTAIDESIATVANTTEVKITYHIMLDWMGITGVSTSDPITNSIVTITTNGSGILVPQPTTVNPNNDNGTNSLTKGDTFTKDSVVYKFGGWFKDEKGGEEWKFESDTTKTDLDLYAYWTSGNATFEVTYIAPDATSNATQILKVEAGSPLPKPDPTVTPEFKKPIYTGHQITAWYTVKDGAKDQKIEDWNIAVTSNMKIMAEWVAKTFDVTFHMNGGSYEPTDGESVTEQVVTVDYDSPIPISSFPDESKISHSNSDMIMDGGWFTDSQCLKQFREDTLIESKLDLYKKWYKIVDSNGSAGKDYGFHVSEDGSILYEYDGYKADSFSGDVVIPNTVKTIAENAFNDMSLINSVTLPANIGAVLQGAFSGMDTVGKEVILYASSTTAKSEAEQLKVTYPNFKYQESEQTEATQVSIDYKSSLYGSNTATGSMGYNSYVSLISYPVLEAGNYTMTFTPNEDGNSELHQLIASKVKITDASRTMYMNISLAKGGTAFTNYNENKRYTVLLPLPTSWQNWKDLTESGKVKVYTTEYGSNPAELELLENTEVVKHSASGLYCVKFSTWHFSEYVVVYSGSMEANDTNSSESGTGSGNSGESSGESGSSSGGSGSGSDSGSSGSGGSDSGSSGSGGSGGSGGGSGSGSASNSSGSGSGSNSAATQTPVTTPVQQLPATGTQPTVSSTGTGNNAGNAHVKDSTPKTGDPLEYRTLLVCSFFSMGILILCVGNKKKSYGTKRYLGA